MKADKSVQKFEKVVEVEEEVVTLTMTVEQARTLWAAARYFDKNASRWDLVPHNTYATSTYDKRHLTKKGQDFFAGIVDAIENAKVGGLSFNRDNEVFSFLYKEL